MTSRERWQRIAEIHAWLNATWRAASALPKPKKSAPRVPYYETPEYVAVVDEYRALHNIERSAAIEADWPIWQEGQHFTYLALDGTLRSGGVIAFDRDAMTVDTHTWPFEDVCAGCRTGEHPHETVTVAQIVAGEQRRDEMEAERAREDAIARGPQQADLFAQSVAG